LLKGRLGNRSFYGTAAANDSSIEVWSRYDRWPSKILSAWGLRATFVAPDLRLEYGWYFGIARKRLGLGKDGNRGT